LPRIKTSETPREARTMVRKELCPQCRGYRYISVVKASGNGHIKCPCCGGLGYKVRVVH